MERTISAASALRDQVHSGLTVAKIVISYRRLDAAAFAGRVRDRIAISYGEDSVFMDVDDIPFGKDFRVHIQEALAEADVALVILGPKWIGAGKGGYSRIKDESDPVRIELETALNKGLPTIPILVGRTSMPKPEQLPESLRDFAFINGASVDTGRDFHRDLTRVIATINNILESRRITAESTAITSPVEDEPASAAVINSKKDESSAEEEIDRADGDLATEEIAPSIQQQPTRDDFVNTDESLALVNPIEPKSSVGYLRRSPYRRRLVVSISIICGCAIVAGGAWWLFNGAPGTVTTASVVPQLASSVSTNVPERSGVPSPAAESSIQSTPPAMILDGADDSTSDAGANVVRMFYSALSKGDGATAATFLVQEKRTGNLSADQMTSTYANAQLRLISVVQVNQGKYRATYTVAHKDGVCQNSAIVAIEQRNKQFQIKSLNTPDHSC
jgi:hypothetical protein